MAELWQTGDIITADKLNETGVEIFLVNVTAVYDETLEVIVYTPSKTQEEMFAAYQEGKIVIAHIYEPDDIDSGNYDPCYFMLAWAFETEEHPDVAFQATVCNISSNALIVKQLEFLDGGSVEYSQETYTLTPTT